MSTQLWQFVLVALAGWMNRQQQQTIEYLQEEISVPQTFQLPTSLARRGAVTVSSGSATLSHGHFAQNWGLDSLGNWSTFQQDDNGTGGTWELDQARTHNAANEITAQTVWAYPAYDAAGNMTTSPVPGNETNTHTLHYDAWNRLVMVKSGSSIVAKYRFDGLHRRIRKLVKEAESNEWTVLELYYNASWQVLETRRAEDVVWDIASPSADPVEVTAVYERYIWSPRYIDAPVLRLRGGMVHRGAGGMEGGAGAAWPWDTGGGGVRGIR